MPETGTPSPPDASHFSIGGDLRVFRIGFGAVQLCGRDGWGEPRDRKQAIAVVRRAVDLGVNLIDTADSYGPGVSEEIIAEALHPYPDDLVIATKGGLVIEGPRHWVCDGHPGHLREALEGSLGRLRLECIDLYQLHQPDPDIPIEESIGALRDMQTEGKIRHIGVSNVSSAELRRAQDVARIVSVQNRYNLAERTYDPLVDVCEAENLALIPWFPLGEGGLLRAESALTRVARGHGATPAQVALAWLLQRARSMLPIPGTASVEHVEENIAATQVALSSDDIDILETLRG